MHNREEKSFCISYVMIKICLVTAFTWFTGVFGLSAQVPDSITVQLESLNVEARAQLLKDYAFKIYPYHKEISLASSAMGVKIAKENELWEKLADGLNTRGIIYGAYRELDSSFACYEKALELCDEYDFRDIKKKVGMNSGVNYFYIGDYEKAIRSYHSSLDILEQENDSIGIAHASGNIGLCHIRRGDQSLAILYLKRALSIYEIKQMTMPKVRTLNALGSAYLEVNLGHVYLLP